MGGFAVMELVAKESADDYLKIARSLAQEFAKTAIERDKQGGTAKVERDLLRIKVDCYLLLFRNP
jgi:hypothetical protein